ncbi:MAG: 2-oxoglutarate dehydrogenase E1 component [Phycisphaerales bacterium JB063]
MSEPTVPAASNLAYVEQLFEQYLQDPTSVDEAWRDEFAGWVAASNGSPLRVGPSVAPRSIFDPGGSSLSGSSAGEPACATSIAVDAGSLQHRVDLLVRNYRVLGHLVAHLNPLEQPAAELPEELTPAYYGFTPEDMDKPFVTTSTVPGDKTRTLRGIIDQLRNTYCRNIAAQFMHIDDLSIRQWLQLRMEGTQNTAALSRKEQVRILTRLTDATLFEEFIQRKFIGAKSFSLEGGETLIPLLDMAFEQAGEQGCQEIVIGMAHRGRLNVLANILGKSPQKIFREFEDKDPELYMGGGDVKYHLGYSGDWRTRAGKNIHLSLCFNPSHLEYVNPVALGRVRAKQDRTGRESRGVRGMAMLIHGDAAFAGEGVVQETLNLSQLEGYHTGGTVHIVVNNQIGFTTSTQDSRSTRYCTDIAKMLQSPIFHVNGESPESVAQVVKLAMDFRNEFKRDVVIDMYCYRKRGHNEGDEPRYTQPRMYHAVDAQPGVWKSYLDDMLKMGGVTQEDADRIAERRTELLEKELSAAKSPTYKTRSDALRGLWMGYTGGKENTADDVDTGCPVEIQQKLLHDQLEMPEGFNLHPKHKRLFRARAEQARGERPLDWAAAESLAIGSLAVAGHRVRLTGQDSQRGTFSHRHAVLHDAEDGHEYCPLQHLDPEQASVEIFNSPLCEAGVLGFEYGYSLDYPDGLIMWEAQFGDFVNCAQVIIDQFIATAEDKWKRLSGLVMMLPHGFEGQGPEHSSARIERFLTSAAEDNYQVCQPTTPAQMFHLLRRQVMRPWRKPLVVFTPKSLLRHPLCVSSFEDLASGSYERVLPDARAGKPKETSRILLCTGRVYYDLIERREKMERDDIAIVRLEQLYPLPRKSLVDTLAAYPADTPLVWVQDEPKNQGAWPFFQQRFYQERFLGERSLSVACRRHSASPATGSKAAHKIEQEVLLAEAFGETYEAPPAAKPAPTRKPAAKATSKKAG